MKILTLIIIATLTACSVIYIDRSSGIKVMGSVDAKSDINKD